jgi:hypothetical protein
MKVSGRIHAPATSVERKSPPVLILQEAAWAPEPAWTLWGREKLYPCQESNPAVQSVAPRYTDCAFPTPDAPSICCILSRVNQNYCVVGLCPLSGILKTREHDVSETGSLSVALVFVDMVRYLGLQHKFMPPFLL